MIDNKRRERGDCDMDVSLQDMSACTNISKYKKVICFDMIKHLVTHLKLELHLII